MTNKALAILLAVLGVGLVILEMLGLAPWQW